MAKRGEKGREGVGCQIEVHSMNLIIDNHNRSVKECLYKLAPSHTLFRLVR